MLMTTADYRESLRNLSPRELAAAFEARSGGERGVAPGREALAGLMSRFPDEVQHG